MLCLVKDGAMVLDELLEKYKSCYFHDCQLDFSATDSTKDLFVVRNRLSKSSFLVLMYSQCSD